MRFLLRWPRIYTWFQTLSRGRKFYQVYVSRFVRPEPGHRILDIGCGPGVILPWIKCDIEYWGVDGSAAYIEAAQKLYGHRGRFLCQLIKDHSVAQPAYFDTVIATGVLHHLDDENARKLLELARGYLRPGGRLVTVDGCFVPGQHWFTRIWLRLDRGKFIRDQEGYERLIREYFSDIEAEIRHDVFNHPNTLLFTSCRA